MNWFKRNKDLMAIDIDARNMIVAGFSGISDETIQLNSFHSLQLPDLTTEVSGKIRLADNKGNQDAKIAALRELVKLGIYNRRNARLTVDGNPIFPRFVRVPDAAKEKLKHIVAYEAEQNVPFSLDEVVWDYYPVINPVDTADGIGVLILAAKIDNLEQYVSGFKEANIQLKSLDAKSLGIINLLRYNMDLSNNCACVLDISTRSTTLVYAEGKKFFMRSIPVATNTIYQEISRELGISFEEVKQSVKSLKIATGSDIPDADVNARIVRNVMTRLHAELNRSTNFYRSQQNGALPSKMYLTGDGSKIVGINKFFEEKLRHPVESLDPFKRVKKSNLVASDATNNAHLLAGVVGLAIREYTTENIEVNLLPELKPRKRVRKPWNVCSVCPFRKW